MSSLSSTWWQSSVANAPRLLNSARTENNDMFKSPTRMRALDVAMA